MIVRFAAEALEELLEAIVYFDERSNTAGDKLVDDVEAAKALLLQFPQSGSPIRHDIRRMSLSRFPYKLIYRVEGDEIRVYAFAHHRRKPDYWHERIDH